MSLLTAIDSTSHVHLIVGSNPLAAARCTKSLEVGAKPFLIASETAELHYTLQKRIESGEVKWLKKSFEDEDVLRIGREEINGVVDAVFVTLGSRDPMSMFLARRLRTWLIGQAHTFPSSANEIEYQSTYPTLLNSAHSPSSPHIPTALYKSA
jgi:hypothetical protein